jgi:hypothetical protein
MVNELGRAIDNLFDDLRQSEAHRNLSNWRAIETDMRNQFAAYRVWCSWSRWSGWKMY